MVLWALLDVEGEIKCGNIKESVKKYYFKDIYKDFKFCNTDIRQYEKKEYIVNSDRIIIEGNEFYHITLTPNQDMVYKDIMTGLYNRNYWEMLLNHPGKICQFEEYSLVIIDIDNLKMINDTKGHLVGDKVIKSVGLSIKNNIRPEDIGIRYGGDEFLILFHNMRIHDVSRAIKRIEDYIHNFSYDFEDDFEVFISSGTFCTEDKRDIEDMIYIADMKLNQEKNKKKSKNIFETEQNSMLLKTIENTRSKLNEIVEFKERSLAEEEIIKVSDELDKLIFEYRYSSKH